MSYLLGAELMSRRGSSPRGGSSSKDAAITAAWIGAAAVIAAALIGLVGMLLQRADNDPATVPPSTRAVEANTSRALAMTSVARVPTPVTLSSVITASTPALTASTRPDWEVVVEPPIAKHYVGSEHEVFVTVRDLNGFVVVGETVHLQIVDGPHSGLVLELQTNSDGQGVFRYTGNAKGMDTIRVWAGAEQYDSLPIGMRAEITHEWI